MSLLQTLQTYTTITISTLTPPGTTLLTLILISLIPPIIQYTIPAILLSKTNGEIFALKGQLKLAEKALYVAKKDLGKQDFVLVSKCERTLITIQKALDAKSASLQTRQAGLNKNLGYFEKAVYIITFLYYWYYNTHILTLTHPTDSLYPPGRYLKSLTFPSSAFFGMLNTKLTYNVPGNALGGGLSVLSVVLVFRRVGGRVATVLGGIYGFSDAVISKGLVTVGNVKGKDKEL